MTNLDLTIFTRNYVFYAEYWSSYTCVENSQPIYLSHWCELCGVPLTNMACSFVKQGVRGIGNNFSRYFQFCIFQPSISALSLGIAYFTYNCYSTIFLTTRICVDRWLRTLLNWPLVFTAYFARQFCPLIEKGSMIIHPTGVVRRSLCVHFTDMV